MYTYKREKCVCTSVTTSCPKRGSQTPEPIYILDRGDPAGDIGYLKF